VVVRSLAPAGKRLRLTLGGGGEIEASDVFLATGKHDVRGAKRPAASAPGDLIGFKTYFRLQPRQRRALDGAIEVILFEGGYAGLQLVEGGGANLCLLTRRDLFDRVGRRWSALLTHLLGHCPHLAARLGGAAALLDRPLSIFQIPYGFVHRAEGREPAGLFRLGDQAGVIPSFSGDGIAIALHTGRLAAATYLAHGEAADLFHRKVREDIAGQIRMASLVYALTELPLGRSALALLCRAFPGVMRAIATSTRVPEAALQRAGERLTSDGRTRLLGQSLCEER
jgi:flavin-dependent dehydrogenase